MATLTQIKQRFWDNDGTLLAGGKVYVYLAGTSTPTNSYTDATGLTANTNPVILDAKGEASIWTNGRVKINVTNSADVQVTGYPVDNVGEGAITNALSDNPIINGEMLVDQVNGGVAFTVPSVTITGGVPSSVGYGPDMWLCYATGAASTAQQVAGQGEFLKALQFNGAASTTGQYAEHRIESVNARRHYNSTVVVPVSLYNSLLTIVTWTAYYANSADNWTACTQIATGTFPLTAADTILRTYSNISFNAGVNAGNGIKIVISFGAQTSGSWVLTGVDMVNGTQSRLYPHLKRGNVFCSCIDYYKLLPLNNFTYAGVSDSAATARLSVNYEKMRATPSITLPASGQSAGSVSFLTSTLAYPTTTGTHAITNQENGHFVINGSAYAGLTVGGASCLFSNGTTNIIFDARL